MQSKRFTLNKEDFKKFVKNALIFGAPIIVAVIASLVNVIPQDAKYYALAIYVINLALDLVKKWYSDNGVVVKETKKKK